MDAILRTMRLERIEGRIRRRILVNFRVDREVARRLVPDVFDLDLVGGGAMAGVCLIRLEAMRPGRLPAGVGLSSENAAYRFAVTRDHGRAPAVYIPRRDTSSALQARLGGRFFPGEYGRINVDAADRDGRIAIDIETTNHDGDVRLRAHETTAFPAGSAFGSLDEASAFFARGALGFSARRSGDRLDGVLLNVPSWRVSSLVVDSIESAFLADRAKFPSGSVIFDNALIMRDAAHEWRALGDHPSRASRAA